jgi:hypothetical protein
MLSDGHTRPHDLVTVAKQWHTPNASMVKYPQDPKRARAQGHAQRLQDQAAYSPLARTSSKRGAKSSAATPKLNPRFVEHLMGFPAGWTDCEPLATELFRLWQRTHSSALRELL